MQFKIQQKNKLLRMWCADFKYENYDEYNDDFDYNKNVKNQSSFTDKKSEHISVEVKINDKQKQSQITRKNQNTTKGKLIEQHHKLRGQLVELATKMDEILQKQREKRKKKMYGNQGEQDQRVLKLKRQLNEQAILIQKNKNEISKLRRNLDNRYDLVKIVEKENELKHLKKQLKALQDEKQSLEKVRKTQDKAIRSVEDKQSQQKIDRMEQQLRELNQKNKKRHEAIHKKEKEVRKLHELYILKQEKIREIQAKISENQVINEDINEYSITQMQEEIKQTDKERFEFEKEGNQRIRSLEWEKKQLKKEIDRKKLILDEKEKDLRLTQMKHKEIIRLISSSQASNHQIGQSRVEKENKQGNKRTVSKKGRQAPVITGSDEQLVEQNSPKEKQQTPSVEKHDYGFSANLDEEVIEDN